jgi:hypothetical protein
MRTYIITEQEQKIIRAFLEKDEKLEGFRMLASRLRGLDLEDVCDQVTLIQSFLEKIGK